MGREFARIPVPQIDPSVSEEVRGPLEEALRTHVANVNNLIQNIVGPVTTEGGLWGTGIRITVRMTDADEIHPDAEPWKKEKIVRHDLGAVPSYFRIIDVKPRRFTHKDLGTVYTGNTTLRLQRGTTPWTDTHVYFLPNVNAVQFRGEFEVLLIP